MEDNIKKCSCTSPYQDQRYGKGMRVHTQGVTKKDWRCTVCSVGKIKRRMGRAQRTGDLCIVNRLVQGNSQ